MSRLISQQEADSLAQPPTRLNLCDVEEKARAAVERARAEAKRILAEAVSCAREMERVAAVRGERAGFDAGFKKGQEAGRAEALAAETQRIQEATATVREALVEMLTEIENHRHEVLADSKQGLLDLAVAIAERICRARFATTSEHLRPLIDEVLEATGRQSGLVLRVNPADYEATKQFVADLYGRTAAESGAAVHLVADGNVERGGCLAERTSGKVDAQVQTQIDRIVSELVGAEAAKAVGAGDQA